jgi:hypothetical protein
VLFKEQVSDPQELECWQIHIDIVQLLQQDSFDTHNLNKLEKATKRWKHLMVKLYGDVVEERKQPASSRKKSSKKQPKKKSRTTKRTATNAGEKETLLSFKFPNFEVAEHWSELIRFLGPPWVQNTQLWEQRHLAAKTTARRTNQINTELAILVKVGIHPFSWLR